MLRKLNLRQVQVKVMSFYYLNTRNFGTRKNILDHRVIIKIILKPVSSLNEIMIDWYKFSSMKAGGSICKMKVYNQIRIKNSIVRVLKFQKFETFFYIAFLKCLLSQRRKETLNL